MALQVHYNLCLKIILLFVKLRLGKDLNIMYEIRTITIIINYHVLQCFEDHFNIMSLLL